MAAPMQIHSLVSGSIRSSTSAAVPAAAPLGQHSLGKVVDVGQGGRHANDLEPLRQVVIVVVTRCSRIPARRIDDAMRDAMQCMAGWQA